MAELVDDHQEDILEQAGQRFVEAQLRGQEPDIEQFAQDYPQFEQQVRRRLQNLKEVDALLTSLTRAEESDFEATVASNDLVGQQFGAFQITEVIGRGGMGVVYKAHDTKLDRVVAVKAMPAHLLGDATAQARFRREAKVMASLSHPNIAVIYDMIEQDEGSGYLILEYIPGETLAERIAREPLRLEETLSIGRQVAEAVSAAHERGVTHRDLKPGNIKITPDDRVKVLDFGLAKASGGPNTDTDATVTQPGRVIGTPAYMSPEQARGKPTDHHTDVWSFGCIMYEMLTSHLPFEGETATDTIARILEREPDWDVLPETTPMKMRVLLRCCLEKDRDKRLVNIANAAIEISEALSVPANVPPATTSSVSRETQTAAKARLRRVAMMVATILIILVAALVVQFIRKPGTPLPSEKIRLVVLPFENLGPAEDEYFTDGITDAITARLAGIHGLGVISRHSAMQYKNITKSPEVIGAELSVGFILEGTVQREQPSDPNSRVRIIPQLIRTSDDTHIWAQTYDNDMSDIFRMQSDLAEEVARALDIALLEPKRQTSTAKPTEIMEAYDYYLRGNEYWHRSQLEDDSRVAIRMYEKAVELDPEFAVAYTQLAKAHVRIYWYHYERSEERLGMAKQAIDKALQLDPDIPEVHLALGYYYYQGHLNYDRALEQFAIAQRNQPNNSEVLSYIGYVQRRQGKFEKALANLRKAHELDPLFWSLAENIAITYRQLREYEEAERYYNRAISLSPDLLQPYLGKGWLYVLWQGDTQKAWAVFEQALDNARFLERQDRVLRFVLLHVFEKNYPEALAQLSSWKLEAIDDQLYFIPRAQLYAQVYGLMGNGKLEADYYASACSSLEGKVKDQPEDARLHSALGIAYAGLGRKKDAVNEGKLGVELRPVTKEAWRGFYRVMDLARIYAMVGEFDAAIDRIEFLLSIPGELSIPLLQLDPVWDPLRNHPRFTKLVRAGE